MLGRYRYTALLFLYLSQILGPAFAASSGARQVPMQMREMAKRVAAGPTKLDVQPLANSFPISSNVPVKVVLRNAENQPVTWDHPCTVELEIAFPSGKVEKRPLLIPTGQSSMDVTFLASEYGIARIRVAETTNSLLPAGNTVYIFAAAQKRQRGSTPSRHAADARSLEEFLHIQSARPHLIYASLRLQNPPAGSPQQPDAAAVAPATAAPIAPPATPQLLLVNSTGKDEILADGKDFARITVYYMDPDGKGAPSDIHIWMTWSNGTFNPQPMIIPRRGFAAEGKLVSASPVAASIALASSAPNIPVQGNSSLRISFSPPIYGFGPATSEPVVKMSLIDREPLIACFFDDKGQCIQTDRKRHVNVSSNNPMLHVEPNSFDVDPSDGTATIFLEPTWRGSASLELWTAGSSKQKIAIEVSIWLVVLLCMAGGIVGGVAAKGETPGSIWWRIFIGILGAIVLVWICVFAVVPQTHSMIAHSLISVLVVGIIGGYGGKRILDFATKKFTSAP